MNSYVSHIIYRKDGGITVVTSRLLLRKFSFLFSLSSIMYTNIVVQLISFLLENQKKKHIPNCKQK